MSADDENDSGEDIENLDLQNVQDEFALFSKEKTQPLRKLMMVIKEKIQILDESTQVLPILKSPLCEEIFRSVANRLISRGDTARSWLIGCRARINSLKTLLSLLGVGPDRLPS